MSVTRSLRSLEAQKYSFKRDEPCLKTTEAVIFILVYKHILSTRQDSLTLFVPDEYLLSHTYTLGFTIPLLDTQYIHFCVLITWPAHSLLIKVSG